MTDYEASAAAFKLYAGLGRAAGLTLADREQVTVTELLADDYAVRRTTEASVLKNQVTDVLARVSTNGQMAGEPETGVSRSVQFVLEEAYRLLVYHTGVYHTDAVAGGSGL